MIALCIACSAFGAAMAQEKYGNTGNIGLGVGYYYYFYNPAPFLSFNYEFDVARQFTLAPFVGFSSFRSQPYYDDRYNRFYYYRETIVPLGVKGTYYFDRLLRLDPAWDLYLAGSLGATIHSVAWEDGYRGERSVARVPSPLFLDLHIGAEYHISRKVGIYADLSTGVSTIGLAIHGKH